MLYGGLSAERLAGSTAGYQETTAKFLKTAKRSAFQRAALMYLTPSSISPSLLGLSLRSLNQH